MSSCRVRGRTGSGAGWLFDHRRHDFALPKANVRRQSGTAADRRQRVQRRDPTPRRFRCARCPSRRVPGDRQTTGSVLESGVIPCRRPGEVMQEPDGCREPVGRYLDRLSRDLRRSLERAAFTWVGNRGFTVMGTGGSADHRSLALRHGDITLVLTGTSSTRTWSSAANWAGFTDHGARLFQIFTASGRTRTSLVAPSSPRYSAARVTLPLAVACERLVHPDGEHERNANGSAVAAHTSQEFSAAPARLVRNRTPSRRGRGRRDVRTVAGF